MQATASTTKSRSVQARFLTTFAALALALSACGASTSTETSEDLPTLEVASDNESQQGAAKESESDGPEEEVDPEQAMAEYDACMKDQGVDMSVFEGAGSGDGASVQEFEVDSESEGAFDFETFEEAQKECESILTDAFGEFEATPEQEAEFDDQMLEMTKCMADAGFEIDFSEGAFELDPDIDFEEFDAAMNECQPEFSSVEVTPNS